MLHNDNDNDYSTRDTGLATWLYFNGVEPSFCRNEDSHVIFCYNNLLDRVKPLVTEWSLGNNSARQFQSFMVTYRSILRMVHETKAQEKMF